MRERIGTSDISDESLQAFFDGELSGPEADAVQRAIDADPELREEFAQLGLVGGLVQHSLQRQANRVPQARFEQIWDQIDRAIAQEDRLRESTEVQASIWSRMWAVVRPLRWPAVAAAAAAAVTLVVARGGPSDPNNSPEVAVQEPAPPAPPSKSEGTAVPPAPKADMLASKDEPASDASEDGDLAPMPVPDAAEVEIHNIEFGGRGGRIQSSGTVPVLYVEEEVGAVDSERSL
jgi:negative regulator of sigma E activity